MDLEAIKKACEMTTAGRATFIANARQWVPELVARVEELEEAMRPFADAGEKLTRFDRSGRVGFGVTVGDCRRAAEVLRK